MCATEKRPLVFRDEVEAGVSAGRKPKAGAGMSPAPGWRRQRSAAACPPAAPGPEEWKGARRKLIECGLLTEIDGALALLPGVSAGWK
jgi:hypothetical protein